MFSLRHTSFVWILLAILVTGCLERARSNSPAKARRTAQVAQIQIGKKTLWVELAKTSAERSLGLMFRPTPTGDQGMLFQAEHNHTQSFWMRNTPSKLDIGFFDSDNILRDIYALEPYNTVSVFSSHKGRHALEMGRGWYKKNSIKAGMKLKILQIRPIQATDSPKLAPLTK